MSKDFNERLGTIGALIAISATLSGVLISITAGGRGWRVLVQFAQFELSDEPVFVASVFLATLGWLYLPGLLMWRQSRLMLVGVVLKQLWFKPWIRLVPVSAILAAMFLFYVPVRYRYFADVYLARQVRDALDRRDMVGARQACSKYVALYPRKGREGSSRDFACAMILSRAANLKTLVPYVRDYKAVSRLPVLYAEGSHKRAKHLLSQWSAEPTD